MGGCDNLVEAVKILNVESIPIPAASLVTGPAQGQHSFHDLPFTRQVLHFTIVTQRVDPKGVPIQEEHHG